MLNDVLNEDVLINVIKYLPDAQILKLYLYKIINKTDFDILFKNKEYTIENFTDLTNKIHFCKYACISFNIHFKLTKSEINFIEKNFKGKNLILHTVQCNLNSLRNIVKNFKEVELHIHGDTCNLSVLYNVLFDVNKNLSICIHSDTITVNTYTETMVYSTDLRQGFYPKKHLNLLKDDLKLHPFLNNLNCTIGGNYLYFRLQ
jgi:hypothetical protein